ncbi:MAG: rhodanese-like domain-containing protein [Bacteroidota bacterium]
MRTALLLFALALAVALLAWWVGRGERSTDIAWDAIERDLATRYPDVSTVSTAQLAERLGDATAPLLLDARDAEEYAVSHLPGARRVDPDASPAELADALSDVDRQRAVVVYCSVGVRSAGVAQRLGEAGFDDVRNLEGSIFRWANEGREVVRDGEPVREVHPYDSLWGRLLSEDLRTP